MSYRAVLLGCLVAGGPLVGCAAPDRWGGYTVREIRDTPAQEVYDTGLVLLRREFGRIEPGGRGMRVQTVPVPVSDERAYTPGDPITARPDFRHFAKFSVAPRGSDAVARLRIEIERRDTTRHETLQPDAWRTSDLPGYTPIERDAATTTEQNTVWTFVRRDQRLERALLAELRQRFAPPPTESVDVTEPAP